jgi:hypothetical protein
VFFLFNGLLVVVGQDFFRVQFMQWMYLGVLNTGYTPK